MVKSTTMQTFTAIILVLMVMFSSLITRITAFAINYDLSYCDRLSVSLLISPAERASTSGVVLQFTQAEDVTQPALFNTTLAWSDFRASETIANTSTYPGPGIFYAPQRYLTNVSMSQAMNASWVIPLTQSQRYHTFVWFYIQPNATNGTSDDNDANTANRTSLYGPGSPFLQKSDVSALCWMFFNEDGTRTPYVPGQPSTYPGANDHANDQRTRIIVGLAVGFGVPAFVLLSLIACCFRKVRTRFAGVCCCGSKRRQRRAGQGNVEAGIEGPGTETEVQDKGKQPTATSTNIGRTYSLDGPSQPSGSRWMATTAAEPDQIMPTTASSISTLSLPVTTVEEEDPPPPYIASPRT